MCQAIRKVEFKVLIPPKLIKKKLSLIGINHIYRIKFCMELYSKIIYELKSKKFIGFII